MEEKKSLLIAPELIPTIIVTNWMELTIPVIVPNHSAAAEILISQPSLAIKITEAPKFSSLLGSIDPISPTVSPFFQPAPDDAFLASKRTYWESNGHITRRVNIA